MIPMSFYFFSKRVRETHVHEGRVINPRHGLLLAQEDKNFFLGDREEKTKRVDEPFYGFSPLDMDFPIGSRV